MSKKESTDSNADVDMNFIVSGIKFPSDMNESYRIITKLTEKGLELKLEKKKTQQQWQVTIADLAKYGPYGIPKQTIYGIMKKAIDSLQYIEHDDDDDVDDNDDDGNKAKAVENNDDIILDINFDNEVGSVELCLQISVAGFPIRYNFPLLPVAREPIDMLEAGLLDVQDEIAWLKQENTYKKQKLNALSNVAVLTLHSEKATAPNQIIAWDSPTRKIINPNCFELETDLKSVIIIKDGIYQVNVRVGGGQSANTNTLALLLNGADIAHCIQSDNGGHQNTSVISEVLLLKVEDDLSVRWSGNQNSSASYLQNAFTIVFLGN